MHILVTGGGGFIGSHLVEYHLAQGDHVHVLDNFSTGRRENIAPFLANPLFRVTDADILTYHDLGRLTSWADRIYHMAAIVGVKRVLAEPIQVLSTNMAGTERLLRSIQESQWQPQILIASSSEVYGLNPEPVFSENCDLIFRSPMSLRWNYAISKLADEALAMSYHQRLGFHVVAVRLFNTTGPRQVGRYGMVVPNFVHQAVHGKPITVYGDGTQSRSFCDVRDTVVMLDHLAGSADSAGQVVNVGNDREISIKDLAELVKLRADSASPIVFQSYQEAYGESFADSTHRRPVLDKLRQLTQFVPRWSLEDSLDDLIALERQALAVE